MWKIKSLFSSVFFYLGFLFVPVVLQGLPTEDHESRIDTYSVRDFSYLLGMGGLSDAALKMHFELYRGYVKNVNLVLDKLQSLRDSGQASSYEFGAFKRRLGWEFDGMRLHEYYFENMGSKSPIQRTMRVYKAIEDNFGTFEKWRKDFQANGAIRGIGWVVLVRDPKNGRLNNIWINEHDVGHFAGCEPLLVMDVWEHAYISQFGLDRKRYMEVFLSKIDWDVVDRRFRQGADFY